MGSSFSSSRKNSSFKRQSKDSTTCQPKKQCRRTSLRPERQKNTRRPRRKNNGLKRGECAYDPYNVRYAKARDLGNGVRSVFVVSPDGRNCSYFLQAPGYYVQPRRFAHSPMVQPVQYVPMVPNPGRYYLAYPQIQYGPQPPYFNPNQYQQHQFFQQRSASFSSLEESLNHGLQGVTDNNQAPHVSIENVSVKTKARSDNAVLENALQPSVEGTLLSTNILEPENVDIVTVYKKNMEELDRQVALSLMTEDEGSLNNNYLDNTPAWLVAANDFQLALQLRINEDGEKTSANDIYDKLEDDLYRRSMDSLALDKDNRSAKEFMESCQQYMQEQQEKKQAEFEEYDESEFIYYYSDDEEYNC